MQDTPQQIRLIAGLGNPGPEYADTRHNAGFMVVDELAKRHGGTYWKDELGSLTTKVRIAGQEVILAKPQSFMNLSGGPLSKLAQAHNIALEEILVIHDELDIPAGNVRVKFAGGHAGHNGLRSIIDKFQGKKTFSRIRFGIGRPPGSMAVADFVLRHLKGSYLTDTQIEVKEAADVAEGCVEMGVLKARDTFNAH